MPNAVNSNNVLTGAPDQLTTGPILSAPRGTRLPEGIGDTIDPAFGSSGYVSEDGLTLTPERSHEGIKDWSGAVVKNALSEFGASLGWAHLETNEESLRNYLGDDNVQVTAATAEVGKRIAAQLKAAELPRKSWIVKMKDGAARVLLVIPDGQITETGEVAFTKTGAITWPVTMTTYPDANGVHVYIYLDDGEVLTAVPAAGIASLATLPAGTAGYTEGEPAEGSDA